MRQYIQSNRSAGPTHVLAPFSTWRIDARTDMLRHMTTATLLWGLLFSSIGIGLFIYGKRQAAPVPLICGIALFLFPMFVTNTMLLVGVGVVLTALPYFFRI